MKTLFADELAASMQRELQPFEKTAAQNSLPQAVEHLHSAIEIFEEAGMTAKADRLLTILAKIACDEHDAKHPSDRHTKGLTPERMIANLKDHGTMFNMADDGQADDFLDTDINDAALEVFEGDPEDKSFEDSD